MRHERVVEVERLHECPAKNKSKQKKILAAVTTQNSDTLTEPDCETMDLSKKNQESTQLCRIMYQKSNPDQGTPEGFWIFHK